MAKSKKFAFNAAMPAHNCSNFLAADNPEYITDLPTAVKNIKTFRSLSNTEGYPFDTHEKGFFIPVESILHILGQNGGVTSGIKIYLGASDKPKSGKNQINLIIVATCEAENSGRCFSKMQ